jgi:hypothetical protein
MSSWHKLLSNVFFPAALAHFSPHRAVFCLIMSSSTYQLISSLAGIGFSVLFLRITGFPLPKQSIALASYLPRYQLSHLPPSHFICLALVRREFHCMTRCRPSDSEPFVSRCQIEVHCNPIIFVFLQICRFNQLPRCNSH